MTYQGRHRKRWGSPFQQARRAEGTFAASLRRIARHIGDLTKGFDPTNPAHARDLEATLRQYAQTLTPWANAAAATMVAEVERRDARTWAEAARGMSTALRREIDTAPTGAAMRQRLGECTKLITSLPVEAAERVRKLTLEGILDATRAGEIAAEIMRSGEVSRSRATMIARTEVARTASVLTEVRATHIGSEGYLWRTADDGDVRPSHKKMADKFVLWSDAPTLDGLKGHAGCLPNCRCYAEPVLPSG